MSETAKELLTALIIGAFVLVVATVIFLRDREKAKRSEPLAKFP